MNKRIVGLSAISIFLGGAYAVWIYTPMGKKILSKWMLGKWKMMAQRSQLTIDEKYLANELSKLNYNEIELLSRYTYFDPFSMPEQEFKKGSKNYDKLMEYLGKIKNSGLHKKADFSELDNVLFPG